MQVAAEIRRGNLPKGKKVSLGEFKIKFEQQKKPSAEQVAITTELTQQKWFALVGLGTDGRRKRN